MDIFLIVLEYLRLFVLLSVLAAAAVTDLLSRRVSNGLILTGTVLEGLILVLLRPAADPYACFYLLLFLGAAACLYRGRLLGGADVKLYLLTALSYPDERGLRAVVASVLAGAAVLPLLFVLMERSRREERACRLRGAFPGAGAGQLQLTIPMGLLIFAGAASLLVGGCKAA